MKKFLLAASLFTLIAGPSFADETMVEVKVPLAPTAAEITELHQSIVDAAESLCSDNTYQGLNVLEARAANERCVRLTYETAVARGRDMNLAAFQSAEFTGSAN
ncbi:hypothetical protein [Ponticaulis sp.]|uniref:hypothetical protein n=1 Tax=Ponticaulis sp. TaxID=2020902 RepID=UPI000B6B4270|nr:hypothetical protein [Ponticaulis sp.]MAI89810.1 hypothetical protein [Ponticaulis sp.]OUX99486.1 MAG: hypothetical protein CBB65_05165 [Hyphomonadaceae bacterium TMED5]|tara:strand:- start:45040 stop:45351 length:312 start_codon:yes stop_codon:yes gene_type:complete